MTKKEFVLLLIIAFAVIMMLCSCNKKVCPSYAQVGNMRSLIDKYDKCPPNSPVYKNK